MLADPYTTHLTSSSSGPCGHRSENETLAGMTLAKPTPLSILPTCVAYRFLQAIQNELEGNSPI